MPSAPANAAKKWPVAGAAAQRWRKLRLADRIMLTSLALTLGVLGVFGSAGYVALRLSELGRTEALLDKTAQIARYEIEKRLSRIEDTIAGAAGQTLVSNALTDARHRDDLVYPFLRDAIRPQENIITAIALVDYRGEFVSRAGADFSRGVSPAALVESVIARGRPQASFLPGVAGMRMLVAHPVLFAPTGTFEGAVIAEVRADALLPAPPGGDQPPYSLQLLTHSGLPVASTGPAIVQDGALRVETTVITSRPEGADTGLRLITQTPRSAALAQLKKMQFVYAVMVLLAAGVSLFFSRRLASRIAGPIIALIRAARAATEQGHAAIQDVTVFGEQELIELADTFNAMGRALREAHAELEARVIARTQELSLAREQIRDIFDSVAEVVYSATPDFSRLHFVSASAKKVFGLAPEQFLKDPQCWFSRINPDDQQRVQQAREEALKNGGGEMEYRILRQDGETRWVRDRFTVLRDPQSQAVLRVNGTASDITAAIDAKEAKLRAEEVLRTLHRAIHASSAGVIISDCLSPDTPVVMVNPAFERITGYTQDEVIGRNCRFLQGADTHPGELAKLRAALKTPHECKVILKNYRKDGSSFWNELSIAPVEDSTGRVVQFVGIMNDISALVDSQQQVVEWAERLDTVFKLSPDGFISLDRDRRVSFANPAFEHMTGIPTDKVVGMAATLLDAHLASLADAAYPYPALTAPLLDQLAQGAELPEAVLYLQKPKPLMLKRILRQSASEKTASIIYLRDVTREMEVDRMKSEFLNTAAHELRTPMASVMGFSELLLNRDFPRAVQLEYLGIIHRQSKRLTQLLNDLLDLARIEARRRGALLIAPHRLDEIVHDTLEALMIPGDKRAITLQINSPLPVVEADAAKIQQALTNLLSNAYKYSPEGGEITLKSAEREHNNTREIGLLVEDHGIGMTPAQLQRAFERFYRADESGAIPGTGLGLSLVKEIIETHGGHVELQSESGKGTVASLWLPLPAQPAPEMEPT